MMTTLYEKGVRVERLLKRELESQGWTVIRSAGSRGPADLVAIRPYSVDVIQVKRCRTLPQVRRAIKEAIVRFEGAGTWFGLATRFEIYTRFKGEWIIVYRSHYSWSLSSDHADLLGQAEWPIPEKEV